MKKIAILGSTGSIGKQTIDIIRKDKKNFKIMLLTTNKNHSLLSKQIKEFKVKNVIVTDNNSYLIIKKKFKKINVINHLDKIDKIITSKLDYTMSSIAGFDGLNPTIKIIKKTKTIAIANKESIICGWSLISKEIRKHKTNFIPVDSEHFSIWSIIKNIKPDFIDKIVITASGGPFYGIESKNIKKTPKLATNHPNWKMGKKISTDSATLMNKVFEVIEAKNIFNLDYNKISILTHPKSYLHAITKFKNGLTKILLHDPDMKIPIYNSIYSSDIKSIKTHSLNLKILNNLELKEVDKKKFPLIKLLNKLPKYTSLFETVLITINDYLVFKFLEKKINFKKLIKLIDRISNLREFQKFKKIKPKNIDDIYELRDYVSLKLDSLGI